MLKEFWNKESFLIKFSGFITAFAGIFLAIDLPTDENAKKALENVQMFWLFLLATLLTVLAIKFIQWLHVHEKKGFIDDLKTYNLLTIATGYLFLWLVLNFFQYIANLYPERFGEFVLTAVPLAVMVFIISFENLSKKWSLFTNFVVVSFTLASGITLIGITLQGFFLKYFYFYWTIAVLPVTFGLILLYLFLVALFKKKKLF